MERLSEREKERIGALVAEGSPGHEFHLVQRARQYGAVVQAAILMSVRHEPVLAIAKWEQESG